MVKFLVSPEALPLGELANEVSLRGRAHKKKGICKIFGWESSQKICRCLLCYTFSHSSLVQSGRNWSQTSRISASSAALVGSCTPSTVNPAAWAVRAA